MDLSKFNFKWEPWARLQAGTSAFFVFVGALISIIYPNKVLMAISFATSTLVMLMEYPVLKIPLLSTNYYIKGTMLLSFAASGMLQAATHTGSLCMVCAGLTYLRAGLNGENGNSVAGVEEKRGKR